MGYKIFQFGIYLSNIFIYKAHWSVFMATTYSGCAAYELSNPCYFLFINKEYKRGIWQLYFVEKDNELFIYYFYYYYVVGKKI